MFDISEGKELPIVKRIRRRYMITITTMINEIFNLDFKIDQLNKKGRDLVTIHITSKVININ